ncbi:MAG: SDR family NAD(P)-dependent oxidoreductase, partial [Deltaproteobacteria bacterium]
MATLFADNLVVITGGSSGIGRALAHAFASEGARLVLTATNESRLSDVAKECAQLGASVSTYAADVSDFEQMQGLFARVREEHGTPDILINNAGILRDKSFLKMEPENWHLVLDVHLNGAYNVSRPAFAVMKDK